MPLKKSEQGLGHDLQGLALDLERHCVGLGRLASRLGGFDAAELMRVITGLYAEVDKLTAYAEEAKASEVNRAKFD